MRFIKTSREDNICNICKKQYPSLSWDHVPPKGGLDLSDMEIRDYSNKNFNPKSPERDVCQNGLRFRTLCSFCNNRLGSNYDECFNNLMKDVKRIITSTIILPPIVTIKTYPTKIIKAVLGHILASKVGYCNTTIDDVIRAYLFNEDAVLTEDIHIYYWLFPFDCTIIRNDVIQFDPNNPGIIHYSVLKSFPLGFAVSYKCEMLLNFNDLTKFNLNDILKEQDIPLIINSHHNWDFPENLNYSGIQLMTKNPNDVFATRKSKK